MIFRRLLAIGIKIQEEEERNYGLGWMPGHNINCIRWKTCDS